MKKLKAIFLLVGLVAINACSNNTNAPLVQPQEKAVQIDENGDILSASEAPKAEIIFVVDNSASMKKHLENVSNNINRFVDEFVKKSNLEFHIAVTSVYDSRRFSKTSHQSKYKDKGLLQQNGEFYPVDAEENKYFLSSADVDLKPKLKKLLNVGVRDLEDGGPEVEEIISPLLSIYKGKAQESHKGFSLGANSYKIFFFITDASDNSMIDTSEAYFDIVASAANGQRDHVMAFGAIIPEGTQSCKRDYGTANNRLESFLKLAKPAQSLNDANTNVVSLCGNFGDKFAKFGEMIRTQTQDLTIRLSHSPDFQDPDSNDPKVGLFVTYGDQRLLMSKNDYFYDGQGTIYINENAVQKFQPGLRFEAKYTPISDYDRKFNKVDTRGGQR